MPHTYASDFVRFLVDDDDAFLVDTDGAYITGISHGTRWERSPEVVAIEPLPVIDDEGR